MDRYQRQTVVTCPPHLLCVSRYSYMIDNVILLITGTLHQRAISELVPKCHPLGSFEQMEAVNIAQTPAELYNAILVDTPLGGYLHIHTAVFKEEKLNSNDSCRTGGGTRETFKHSSFLCSSFSCILPGLHI